MDPTGPMSIFGSLIHGSGPDTNIVTLRDEYHDQLCREVQFGPVCVARGDLSCFRQYPLDGIW
jgi:hypothetical protein